MKPMSEDIARLADAVTELHDVGDSIDRFLSGVDLLSGLAEQSAELREALRPVADHVADLRRKLLIGAATLRRLADTIEKE
jgi:ABC-type transporter Mla subunit MlaD